MGCWEGWGGHLVSGTLPALTAAACASAPRRPPSTPHTLACLALSASQRHPPPHHPTTTNLSCKRLRGEATQGQLWWSLVCLPPIKSSAPVFS